MTDTTFPIAAVGALEGGSASITELVRHLGDKPGVALVVVHQLDPTQASKLADLLSRAGSMPVHAARAGSRVEQHHVYVVPSDAGLVLRNGVLHATTPEEEAPGASFPIDRFLESLAEDQRAFAIGVLLSGSGSDGTRGMRAIQSAGGTTFAEGSSAEYRSMPDSAIAAGCADFVLAPAAIAAELTRIGKRPPLLEPLGAPAEQATPELRLLLAAQGQDLASMRRYLEGRVARLEASNQELDASNQRITAQSRELHQTHDELQRNREELQATNAELRAILDSAVECLLVADREQHVRWVNRTFCETFGLNAAAIQGKDLRDLPRGPWNAPGMQELLGSLDQPPSTRECRLAHTSPDGRALSLRANAQALADGRLLRLAFEDVSAIDQAERALLQNEVESREVLATAAIGILMVDAAGQIVFANSTAAELFGYDSQELVGQPVERLVPEVSRERHVTLRAQYMAAPARRRMARDRELVGRKKDGTEVSIDVTLSPLTRASSRFVICFVSDISPSREAARQVLAYQEKLRQLAFESALGEERQRRHIAADLHDRIGQALTAAQMRLQALRERGASDAELDAAIDLVAQSSMDVRTLSFELSPPILYDLGLAPALSWLADDLEKRWGIRIEVIDDESEKPLDNTTAALAFRAVRELLSNVLKHARTPTAQVALRRSGDHLEISVEDEGVGFDPQSVAPPSAEGGFGLFSVHEQIRHLGGTLEVQSAPRQGTRVNLRLPLRSPEPPSTDPSRASEKLDAEQQGR